MVNETVEVLVVGAGQAGIAMSDHLGQRGVSHLVLERGHIAKSDLEMFVRGFVADKAGCQ